LLPVEHQPFDLHLKGKPMKKSAVMLFSITALVGFSSLALAGTTPAQKAAVPVDVTAVAAPVASVPNHVIDLSDEEILSVASPVDLAVQGLSAHALSVTTAGEIESPETEGPDTDGPGGPDHEFEGEETGQH
jgi:hypothetical protein